MSETEVKALLTAAGLEPIGCYPTLIEGIWEAVYDVGTVPTDEKFEAAGFSLPGIAQDITEFGETVTVIRFRLPDAPEAAAPRYYVEESERRQWYVRDSEKRNAFGQHLSIETFWTREKAAKHAAELNTAASARNQAWDELEAQWDADAPIEAPQHPVLTTLKALNVDALSPMEALTKLYELKRLAGQE